MKKLSFILGLLLLAATQLVAQEQIPSIVPDTIFANETKNVALFFPDPIRQGVTGSEEVVFTYNREKQQYFGLLQATPGAESNLLVISNSGAVFSYIIKYSQHLERLNYFIPSSGSIGNENPGIAEKVEAKSKNSGVGKSLDSLSKRDHNYQRFCSFLLSGKQKIGRIKKRTEDIVLSVENIVFRKDQLYFVMGIQNRSSMDYDLGYLNLSVEIRKKGRNKSMQKLLQKPVYRYEMPEKISRGSTERFIYVMPKFSISKEKKVVIYLKEKNGERDLKLNIPRRFINHPN